jgi:hypothetical protein
LPAANENRLHTHYAASARENKLRGLSGGKESFDILFYAIYFHLPQAIQENVHANITVLKYFFPLLRQLLTVSKSS